MAPAGARNWPPPCPVDPDCGAVFLQPVMGSAISTALSADLALHAARALGRRDGRFTIRAVGGPDSDQGPGTGASYQPVACVSAQLAKIFSSATTT